MTMKFLNQDEKLTLAVNILKRGKDLAADRFPKPNPGAAQAWASSLGKTFDRFPFPDMWNEAVDYWASELVTARMAAPRDIKDAAYEVSRSWRRDPQRSALLQQWRDAMYEKNTGLPAAPRELGA